MACAPCNKTKNAFLEKKNAEAASRVAVSVTKLPVQVAIPSPPIVPAPMVAPIPDKPHSKTTKQFVIVSKINRVQQRLEDIKNFETGLKS